MTKTRPAAKALSARSVRASWTMLVTSDRMPLLPSARTDLRSVQVHPGRIGCVQARGIGCAVSPVLGMAGGGGFEVRRQPALVHGICTLCKGPTTSHHCECRAPLPHDKSAGQHSLMLLFTSNSVLNLR